MASFAQLVSTESPTAAQEHYYWVKYMSTEGFSPWENEYLHCHAEKMPNDAGNEGRVASSVSSFVFHHTIVCEFMTALIKHNSLTPSALIHPYTRALLPLNVTVGTKHFSLYSSSSSTRTFWMLLDPKWLTWSLETRVWIPRSLYFVDMGPGRG